MYLMHLHHLCLAWNWEHDRDFAALLESACTAHGLSLLQVTPENLASVLAALSSGEMSFRALLDRASDTMDGFLPLVDYARQAGTFQVNSHEQSRWAWDKATMHLEFITAGLQTPYTFILSPYEQQPDLPIIDFSPFGGTFNIKPAVGGGGWGVVMGATSMDQVHAARREYPHEKVLLQAHVEPVLLESRPAWFRLIYCDGAVYPCWWHPHTHLYDRLSAADSARFGLSGIKQVVRRIANLCHLYLFSTEIALTADGRLVVADYVNDPIDLRLRSSAGDGVPDEIVVAIAGRLVHLVERNIPRPFTA